MRKCIVLNNRELTGTKSNLLNSFVSEYLRVSNAHLPELPFADSQVELHHRIYSDIKNNSFLPSDMIEDVRKNAWIMKRHMVRSGYNGVFEFKKCSIRLSKRFFRYIMTERGNPCFKITYSPHKFFVIPIEMDRQFERFNGFLNDGWSFDNVSLLKDGRISVVLEKDFSELDITQRYVLGIDIGSSFAVTVFDTKTSRVVKQLYFGQDVSERQNRFYKRRKHLQGLADKGYDRAKKSLKRLKHDERNFVKTRMGQIAKEIVILAKAYNAYIAYEKLKDLKSSKFSRKSNRKINRIPYDMFRTFLISNASLLRIPAHEGDAYHTSKWCTHCGSVNPGHNSKVYAIYKCRKCKQIVNSDRKASLAIAVKSVLERRSQGLTTFDFFQISRTRVPVNGLLRFDDKIDFNAVHDDRSSRNARGFSHG